MHTEYPGQRRAKAIPSHPLNCRLLQFIPVKNPIEMFQYVNVFKYQELITTA